MSLIQGVGGVFYRVEDPARIAAWYGAVFGVQFNQWGSAYGIEWPSASVTETDRITTTVFSLFPAEPTHPSMPGACRINLRVEDMDAVCDRLTAAQVAFEEVDGEGYGRFVRLTDPEGHELELWEPPLR